MSDPRAHRPESDYAILLSGWGEGGPALHRLPDVKIVYRSCRSCARSFNCRELPIGCRIPERDYPTPGVHCCQLTPPPRKGCCSLSGVKFSVRPSPPCVLSASTILILGNQIPPRSAELSQGFRIVGSASARTTKLLEWCTTGFTLS